MRDPQLNGWTSMRKNMAKYYRDILLVLLFNSQFAFAYVDPGLGQFAWQSVLSVFFGVVFYWRKGLLKMARFVGGRFRGREGKKAPETEKPHVKSC